MEGIKPMMITIVYNLEMMFMIDLLVIAIMTHAVTVTHREHDGRSWSHAISSHHGHRLNPFLLTTNSENHSES